MPFGRPAGAETANPRLAPNKKCLYHAAPGTSATACIKSMNIVVLVPHGAGQLPSFSARNCFSALSQLSVVHCRPLLRTTITSLLWQRLLDVVHVGLSAR